MWPGDQLVCALCLALPHSPPCSPRDMGSLLARRLCGLRRWERARDSAGFLGTTDPDYREQQRGTLALSQYGTIPLQPVLQGLGNVKPVQKEHRWQTRNLISMSTPELSEICLQGIVTAIRDCPT